MNTTTVGNVTFVHFPHQGSAAHIGGSLEIGRARVRRLARRAEAEALRNDAEGLVERLAFGDLDAAVTLRHRYEDDLRSIADAILDDAGEAARVVDRAFEEACSGWPPQRGRVERWLRKLVRRAARERRRELGFNA